MTGEEWNEFLVSSIRTLHERQLFRSLRPLIPTGSSVVAHLPVDDPTPIKLFSLNDYLGLATHPRVRTAAAEAYAMYGNGPRASALIAGYTTHHRELETSLADLKSTEECLLFPTGFAANMAVVSSLAVQGTTVFSDQLNHASIVDGTRLGKQLGTNAVQIYKHNDLQHLESLLINPQPRGKNRDAHHRQVVVTDALFSMDGDYADLEGLARLKQKYGFLFAVDEAHSTLVCGPRGAGAAAAAGIEHLVDLQIGTLSKAFGCMGGFVACSRQWKEYFVNLGRAQVFSTALPVPVVVAAHTALHVSYEEPWRQRHVDQLMQRVGRGLQGKGLGGVGGQVHSPIIPVVLGDEKRTMDAAAALWKRGYHVPGIRPPTVPVGSSRLRISLSAAHSTADVDGLVREILDCCCESSGRSRL